MCPGHHSHPPGLESPIVWCNAEKLYKRCLSPNWTLSYDSSHLCNTYATVIGLLAHYTSDILRLIKANKNSHYMCSEVSLTYGNADISYGHNLPSMWMFPEGFFFFLTLNLCISWKAEEIVYLPYVCAFPWTNNYAYSCYLCFFLISMCG